jgi:hypothetical protein
VLVERSRRLREMLVGDLHTTGHSDHPHEVMVRALMVMWSVLRGVGGISESDVIPA